MSEPAAVPCPTCGTPIDRRFCGACGEQRVTAHDYSIVHFAEHILESLTHFDFKSLRALKTLMVRPGQLTRDYLDGRRRGYIGPIQLFVIVNVAFALAGPSTFRTPLAVQEHDRPFPALKQSLVADAMATRNVEHDEFRRSFDDAAGLQAKTWVFAMIPLIAVVTATLYGFRRLFYEQLIFATHFLTFMLVWMLGTGIVFIGGSELTGMFTTGEARDSVMSLITLIGLIGYLVPAFRRVFGDGWGAAAARALGVGALFLPVLLAYRFLLFFVTLWTMH